MKTGVEAKPFTNEEVILFFPNAVNLKNMLESKNLDGSNKLQRSLKEKYADKHTRFKEYYNTRLEDDLRNPDPSLRFAYADLLVSDPLIYDAPIGFYEAEDPSLSDCPSTSTKACTPAFDKIKEHSPSKPKRSRGIFRLLCK